MILRSAALLATLLLPAVALAAPPPVQVQAGKPKHLMRLVQADAKECVLKPVGKVHIQKEPAHGTVNLKQAKVTGDHKTCGRIEGKAIIVVYTPKPGYTGPDETEFVLVTSPEENKSGAIERRFFRVPIEVR